MTLSFGVVESDVGRYHLGRRYLECNASQYLGRQELESLYSQTPYSQTDRSKKTCLKEERSEGERSHLDHSNGNRRDSNGHGLRQSERVVRSDELSPRADSSNPR